MNKNTEELRKKYMDNPPGGMTSGDIRHMSRDDLPDMDYFLNEDDPFSDDFSEEGLLYLLKPISSYYHAWAEIYLTYVR